jgi:hypothetical protein
MLLIFMVFTIKIVNASHFRHGSITWSKTSGSTTQVKFNIAQSWRKSAYGAIIVGQTVNTGTFTYGDGTSANVGIVVTSVNNAEDWFSGEAILTKTYATPPSGTVVNYTARYSSCCRISTLVNGNNDQSEIISTIVNIGNTNNSPISTIPPFVAF